MRYLAFLLLAMATLCGCARETTVILVRHAERATDGKDPGLTPEGETRAQALAAIAERERVRAIYVTPFKRTQDTAAPSAARLGLTPVVVPVDAVQAHADAIAESIRKEWKGQSVLVVGHSNTVPLVMKALGAQGEWKIEESQFDRMFVVRWLPDGPVRVSETRY